jgi:hypothetical protein
VLLTSLHMIVLETGAEARGIPDWVRPLTEASIPGSVFDTFYSQPALAFKRPHEGERARTE